MQNAFDFVILHAAETIPKLYSSERHVKNFEKATTLDHTSRSLLEDILATGQFDWTLQHHRCWAASPIEIITKKNGMVGKESSTRLHRVTFVDQLFVILLISKFRTRSISNLLVY